MTATEAITPEVLPPVDPTVVDRAEAVRLKLREAREQAESSFMDMCDLLMEAKAEGYHRIWGYAEFGQWIEEGSDLDMSARQAYYMINIARTVQKLGLSREQVKEIKISKLKEIFSLDSKTQQEEIKALVAAAPDQSLEEIKAHVRNVKTQAGEEPPQYVTYKIDSNIKQTVDEAFALARLNYGDTMGQDGEPAEISNSKALELVCVCYLNDQANYPEGVTRADLVI
jgi:hypothetical protein